MGGGGPIGKGEHFMSWVHVQDLARLYASAAENNIFSGTYNAVSPQYVSNQEFTRALSQSLRRPAFLPVPPFVLKILFGEMSTIMLDSQKIISTRIKQTPYSFQFPSIQQALDDICQ